MVKGTAGFRLGLAVALVAGAVVAGVAAIRILSGSVSDGRIAPLVAGLALGAAALAAAGISAWLILLLIQSDEAGSEKAFRRRRRVAFSILVLAAVAGPTWLLIESAARQHTGSAWITGTLALLASGLVILTWVSSEVDVHSDVWMFSLPIVLGEASLGLLAVGFAGDHNLIVARLLAGLAIAESASWMMLPEAVASQAPAALVLTAWAFAIAIPAASAIGAVVDFAIRGNVLEASLIGAIGFAVLLFGLWRFGWFDEFDVDRFYPSFGFLRSRLPGTTIPVAARLGGLVIPLGTIVWAAVVRGESLGTTAAVRLLGATAWATVAAIALLLLQGLVIRWLRPAAAGYVIAEAAREAQLRGHPPSADPGRSRYDPGWAGPGDSYGPMPYERDRSERTRYEQERAMERVRRLRRDVSVVDRVVRPLGVHPAALSAGLDLAESTGLDVDQVWPQLQLVAPSDVRREVARKDRVVAVLRVAAASAICTALAWPLSAGVILTGASAGVLAALVLAPLAVSAVAVTVARSRLADVYLRRVRTTEVYRFNLLRELHLPLANDDAEFAALSRYIDGSDGRRPIVWPDNVSPEPRAQPSYLPETLASEVARLAEQRIEMLLQSYREQLHRDQAELVTQQREQFHNWLSAQALGPQELALMANHIADRAAAPISDGLGRRIAQIQQEFSHGLRTTLEQVVGESVLGPALTNFTGYLSLELHRASEEDPGVGATGGTIRTRPAHELGLVMSVVRNPAAARVASMSQGPDNSFLVLEPFVIEGGRDAPIAAFDVVADCATLTPLPRRKNLNVATRDSTSFRFKLPDREGQHELWFQLYQAGRLIQVVAISVEVGPDRLAAT